MANRLHEWFTDRRFERFLRRAFRDGILPPPDPSDDAPPIPVPDHLREAVLRKVRAAVEEDAE